MPNLTTNAIKFTHNGTIKINCFGLPVIKPEKLYFEVEDSGIGIPKDKISSLFKEFSKVKNEKNLNPNGIGLGLYICKRIVEGCGGEIKISRSNLESENPFDHGTTFDFFMPILETKNSQLIQQASSGSQEDR
jgi:signal transduction histidine kinase